MYRIVSAKHSNAMLYTTRTLNWTSESINVLGITLDDDSQVMLNKNYQGIVQNVDQIIGSWKNRGLSLCGMIIMLNSLIGLLFVYKMNVLRFIPEKVIQNMYSAIRKYIWKGGVPRIATEILLAPKEH